MVAGYPVGSREGKAGVERLRASVNAIMRSPEVRRLAAEAVLHDVDGQVHVAVSPVSDPLAELQRCHGRFLYFSDTRRETPRAA